MRMTFSDFFLGSILSVVLFSSAACQKKDEEDEDETAVGESSEASILESLPTDQPSPVQDSSKVGAPSEIRILLETRSLALGSVMTVTLLSFDASGAWINSDKDIEVNLETSGGIEGVSLPDRVATSQLVLKQGSPSQPFGLRGKSTGEGTLLLKIPSLGQTLRATLTVGLTPVIQVVQTSSTPRLDVCSPITFSFYGESGAPGIFSQSAETRVSLSPAGCSIYQDAACVSQISEFRLAPDESASQGLYVKAGSSTAFVEVSAKAEGGSDSSAFRGRMNCGGI